LVSSGITGTSDLTILMTEHLTLQSARQLCLQDMQNRSTMFLTAVSASLIAIAFFGNATQFRGGFVVFVLALLISLWVLGALTWARVVQAAIEDVIICFGLARIRHRYAEIAPDVRDLFVRSIHDDFPGIYLEMGSAQGWWQSLMPTYIGVAFVTSVLAGAAVAFSLNEIAHATLTTQMVAAVATFTINAVLFRLVALRLWSRIYPRFRSRYPSHSS
jgi:hypothetical protein